MKTIIAGSRGIKYRETMEAIRACPWRHEITSVVSGGCRGPDRHGESFARAMGLPLTIVPADWGTYGKSAGVRRNKEMAEISDALIAAWDGVSRGTEHMIKEAFARGIKVYIYDA